MKINSLANTNMCEPYSNAQMRSKMSFRSKYDVFYNNNGEPYTVVDILDKQYKFKINEDTDDAALETMIENIKKTQTGYFYRIKRHEYFAPYIFGREPKNILLYEHIIRNGNAETEIDEETINAHNKIQEYAKKQFDIKELKTIRYLKMLFGVYANNIIKKTFGYYDEEAGCLYFYKPRNNKLQILTDANFVKYIKLNLKNTGKI